MVIQYCDNTEKVLSLISQCHVKASCYLSEKVNMKLSFLKGPIKKTIEGYLYPLLVE